MGSPWTDESAILRDLSFAQGRLVPGGLDSAVAGGKPPAHYFTEETEEEYFRHWVTDGDFSSGPDLPRIKKMLELMQDEEASDEDIPSGPIEIRKLNFSAPDFVLKAKHKDDTKENKYPVKNKPRRARNVAMASIMALANQLNTINHQHIVKEPLKLSKPEDFMKLKQDNEEKEASECRKVSVNKVTNWLKAQDMTSMFKKKSSVNSLKENIEYKNSSTGSGSENYKISPVKSESVKLHQNNRYTPSSWAQEYYEKAVNRSHMRDLVRDDVWSRAEKIMKEIDTQKAEELRKQEEAEAALAAEMAAAEAEAKLNNPETIPDSAETTPIENNTEGIAHILLAKNRHDLFDCECIVCKVLTVQPGQSTEPTGDTPTEILSDPDYIKLDDPEITGTSGSQVSEGKYFGLIRSKFVENLHESDPELLCAYLSESDSFGEIDI